MLSELTTPVVIVDLDIAEHNIETFARRLHQYGIAHRPHIKTHKSIEMGRKQMAAGAIGITVAKLGEAEVFAANGFGNILLAYPIIGQDKLARFAKLHREVRIITTVDSMEVATGLAQVGVETGKSVEVLVELDLGMHRCGVQPEDAVAFAEEVRALGHLSVIGIMEYNALVRNENSVETMKTALRTESDTVAAIAQAFKSRGFDIQIVSSGSTIAGTYPEVLHTVTEVRSGTYIYHDVNSVVAGIADPSDCALTILATVVSTPLAGHATFDAGSKTLTSDLVANLSGYGMVVDHPEVLISALNEEHGYLQFDPATAPFAIGDRIRIIPNHACVVSNLTDVIYGVRGDRVMGPISVDARGCNK